MRRFIPLARVLILLMLIPTAAQAVPLAMTPDPLGDWVISPNPSHTLRTADVTLQSGDTSPTPTVVFRTSLVGGGATANTTISFDFDFDVDITSAVVSATSGAFGVAPSLFVSGGGGAGINRLMTCNCAPAPCTIDITFEFATAPATLDVTDTVNQFGNSPGAPFQELSATFSPVALPALDQVALLALGVVLIGAGGRALRR